MSEQSDLMFPNLFSPLKIGNVTLRNRIVSSGHDTVMVEKGFVTDQLVAYQQARAEGGVGLIVMQVAGVHETARYTYHVLMATSDECIPGYRRVANAVHAFGCPLFGQLFHPGREILESQDGSAPIAYAPSAVPNERFRVMPRAMSIELIEEIVEGYASAAARLREGGLDGVEIVSSHGYLPSQFLNPAVNQREDDYGGSFDKRLRFLREVISAVRARVGEDFVVGLRICADEMEENGLTQEESLAATVALDRDGALDYLSVTLGTSATLQGSDHIVPAMNERVGYAAPYAARVKQQIGSPVLVAGRINQPQDAERVLSDGVADAVIMNRALICDPTMPSLAKAGMVEDIRACIACNQACIGHFLMGYPISCIQHPETGRELLYGRRTKSIRRRRVLVAGGGPAGLKVAAVASERGHEVSLFEASARLGGQILLAEQLPDREEFGGAAINLAREAERAGVKIVTKARVDRDLVLSEKPDVVVVATGAKPRRPPIEVMGDPRIAGAWDVIRGETLPPGRVLVTDWKSDWVGAGVARLLARRGHDVILAVNTHHACERLQQYVRDFHVASLRREKVDVLTLVRLYGVDDDSVYLQHVLTKEPVIIEGVASVVLAEGHLPNDELISTLAREGVETVAIGDCLTPRSVEEAVLEGLVAGSKL